MSVRIVLRTSLVIGVFSNCVAAATKDSDAFRTRLEQLRSQEVTFERTRALTVEYEKLIDEFPQHRDRSIAMYDLAKLYDGFRNDEQTPVGNSQEEAIKWYQFTRAEATKGSKIWIDATFDLARCIRGREDERSISNSRALIELLATRYRDQFPVAIKAKAELICQCIAEKQFETADRLCRELVQHESQDNVAPLSTADASLLSSSQLYAAVTLMEAMLLRPGTKSEKQDWFDDFAAEAKGKEMLVENLDFYKNRFATVDTMMPDVGLPKSTASETRKFLIAANLAAVLVLSFLALQHRRSQRTLAK